MKHLSWIISLPLLAIAVIFAVNHRQRVEIDLWPLPLQVEPPLYLGILLAIFVGFVLGGFVVWLSQGRHRRRARERRFELEKVERERAFLQRRLEKAEADARSAQGAPSSAAPAAALPPRAALPSARTGT